MPLEPLICRSRNGNIKRSYKNKRKFGESKKSRIFVVLKEKKSINRSKWNNKKQKLWQQQIGQLSQEEKTTEQ